MLRSEKFDLAISDNLDLCYYGLTQYLNIPIHIYTSSGIIPEHISWLLGFKNII